MNYKFYEEKAKKLNKVLLIEETLLDISKASVEYITSSKLIESQGQVYEALAIVKNVPVSKYTENFNGRSYPRKLWEKIFNERAYEGTYALADHPENEGSVKDVWGIWREMEVREDGVYGTLYLIEEKPVRILKAGGALGTSSVGYGELDERNCVIPESYELERLADIVINPSQGTYMKTENLNENKNIENSNSLFSESITNKCNDNLIIKEEIKSEEQYTMLKESVNIKNNIRVILKEAKANKKSVKEAIDDIKFWQENTPLEEKELHTYINSSLAELSEKMEIEVSNATKSLKEKEISLDELKAKYKVAEDTIKDLTERYKKAQTLIEKGGVGDYKVLSENAILMKKDIDKLMKERSLMGNDIRIYTEDVTAMKSDINILMKERKEMLGDIKIYENKLKEAEKHITTLEKILEDDYGYAFDDNDTEVITASELDSDDIIVDGEVYEPKDEVEDIMDMPVDDSMSYSEHYTKKYKEAEDNDKEDKKDDDDDDKKDKDDEIKEAEEDKDSDKKDDEDRENKKDDDDKKEESIKRMESKKTVPAVVQLFNEALRENKSLNDVRKQILESKSVLEASKKIQKFMEVKGNDSISARKSKKDDSIPYKFGR